MNCKKNLLKTLTEITNETDCNRMVIGKFNFRTIF